MAAQSRSDRWPAACLLVAVPALAHYGPDRLCIFYTDPELARRWLFHIFRSLEVIALAAALMPYLRLWGRAGWLAIAGATLAVMQESEVAVCAAVSFGTAKPVGRFQGLCDVDVGNWIYLPMLSLGCTYLLMTKRMEIWKASKRMLSQQPPE